MKLSVHVIEARGLPASDSIGPRDVYARVSLGKKRVKTKIIRKTRSPYWDEEFSFKVGDLSEVLSVTVFSEDKYFNDTDLGQVKVPLLTIFDSDNHCIANRWHSLQPKNKKSKTKERGEICYSVCLLPNVSLSEERAINLLNFPFEPSSSSDKSSELSSELPSSAFDNNKDTSALSRVEEETQLSRSDNSNPSSLVDLFVNIVRGKIIETAPSSRADDSLKQNSLKAPVESETCEIEANTAVSDATFDELLRIMESKDQGGETPAHLPGGVVIDKYYAAAPCDLNSLLFSPDSKFSQSIAELQGMTNLKAIAWRFENNGENLKRVLTYTKAATKLIKAVKATEEQIYLKADGKSYAVLASVSIPDVPYGSYFNTEVLYCISPGPELPSESNTSHLVVSWRTNFLQSTMMKGMIENGTRQGLSESFQQFADLLRQNVNLVDSKDAQLNMEQILGSLQKEKESNWKLTCRFFGNFTFISSVLVGSYVFAHILSIRSSVVQGLEFSGLDLPDSIEELIVCGILVLQGERVLNMVRRFLQVRTQSGATENRVREQGDGWLLTVALIEGSNLAAADLSGFPDPYVVFSCNGKRRTSSIKFQTTNPQWKEVFEFDAMDDPPSMMDIHVYDFDCPFDDCTSLGHAEVNFLKYNESELADIWLPLQGKFAQPNQSKLHLRIFLNNTRGSEVITEYLLKMEKEVGKKINLRSPHTNSTFQKLFGLPPEEFLINDFTCHLKRKMPLQGRLFLSPRVIGYYSNLFGHKTKFFFLWEDIEDVQVVAPTLASMGSPSLLIILRKGRGMDAKHGAKSVDRDGRLKFHFQSFVSFQVANRTIMALWRARPLTPEQKMQIAEKESETPSQDAEETDSFLGIEDAKFAEVFSASLPINVDRLLEIFAGGDLERKIMETVGCVDYSVTPWESVKPDIQERQVNYKFTKNLSCYGGEAASTQQKSPLPDSNGWVIEEVMTLLGVFLGDYFNLHLRYQVEESASLPNASEVQILLGIAWLKSTKHQKRIAKNLTSNSSIRIKEMFCLLEKELVSIK